MVDSSSKEAQPWYLGVLVLGYRTIDDIKNGTLARILRSAARVTRGHTTVTYLDNYGCDGSVEYVLREHKEVDVLLAPNNLMYCGGVNAGLRYLHRRYKPKYFLVCDADNIVEEDTFERLTTRAEEDSRAGIVQPLVRSQYDQSRLYSCGHYYDESHMCRPMSQLPADISILADLPSCSILATLFKAKLLLQIGLLDPVFRIYYESSDISFRARGAGWRCVCEPSAVAYHEGRELDGLNRFHMRYYVYRNWPIFWRLHDASRFAQVQERLLTLLDDFEAMRRLHEFGLDSHNEAIRTGIHNGLMLCAESGILDRPVERLDDFARFNCSLLNHRPD